MQNTHSQQDNTQGQNTLLPPQTVQYMEHNKNSVQQDFSLSPQVGQEAGEDKDSPYNFNNPPTTALDDSRDDVTKKQCLSLSPCSLSPGLSANTPSQPQPTGEHHRGRRSSRTRFTEQQLETLQGVFEATPYPREEEYDRLSALLSLPNRVIVVWFQNARQRARKNQDRGAEDGSEEKNQLDNISRQRNGSYKTDVNNQDNSYDDEGQGDSQNENSMDLTYEYYTHPDSPALDSSTYYSESELLTTKSEQTSTARKQEAIITSHQATVNPATAHAQNKVLDADSQQKEIAQPIKTEPSLQPESPSERPQTLAASSPDCEPCEKVADPLPSSPSAPELETIHTGLPDATACLSSETQQQLKVQAQFQCSLCPASLPSFQLWQEHQTRHLLAAQSQVQLFHSGFAERPLPYMMLHPNHTLMASQLLSGAMSQIPPNPTHPMISHLTSMQMKSTFSDHSNSTLSNSLTPMKQSTKQASETSFEAQRGNRDVEEEHRRDKRQRTTITPEQLEVLYQRYSLDSNPTRGVLESIARDVGLTRRVVQVML
uniref:Homeobox domain-containing protein n=1 Tax=Kryptolebias marmoratus TaxID=37003 RepID=A0A3Q3APL7_KRYMA